MLTTKIKKGILVAKLTGELDHHTAGSVRDTLDRLIMGGTVKHILFDFSSLSMMDSSGVGMIIGRYKLISPDGGKISIFATGKNVLKLLKMSGVEKIAPIKESIEKAEEYLI